MNSARYQFEHIDDPKEVVVGQYIMIEYDDNQVYFATIRQIFTKRKVGVAYHGTGEREHLVLKGRETSSGISGYTLNFLDLNTFKLLYGKDGKALKGRYRLIKDEDELESVKHRLEHQGKDADVFDYFSFGDLLELKRLREAYLAVLDDNEAEKDRHELIKSVFTPEEHEEARKYYEEEHSDEEDDDDEEFVAWLEKNKSLAKG